MKLDAPRLLSIALHVVLIGLALFPWTPGLPSPSHFSETAVVLYTPSEMVVKPLRLPQLARGGGGGGKHQTTQASHGVLPRGADKQLVPPDPETPKNPNPELVVEPTIVAPQLAMLRPI